MSKELLGQKTIGAAGLEAMADMGDWADVFAQVARRLLRSHDPEDMMAADLVHRYLRKGPEPAETATWRPPRVVNCKRMPTCVSAECMVSRSEIALTVYLGLRPDPRPSQYGRAAVLDPDERRRLLRRRGLLKAVTETSLFFGISENVVRDCFEEYCENLFLFADEIKWS
ncbi:hypothetical protein [Rhizobium sp. BK661]|uniref:hypothetical protein n=1 Tax=Rhizobium sp. BK661 TaxID=2586991 RepID=UPI0021686995|nr:hypothetical protein [Rhizobium sp. BK661]MCS3744315.1 hypothetical protein [Rhizobium sp. BK661]